MTIHSKLINDVVNPLLNTVEDYILISRSVTEKKILIDLIGIDVFRVLQRWVAETKTSHPIPTAWLLLSILSSVSEHYKFSLPDHDFTFVQDRITGQLNRLFGSYITGKLTSGEYKLCNNHPRELVNLSLTRGITIPNEIEFIDLSEYISISNLQRFDITDLLKKEDGVCVVCRNLQFIGGTKNA